MSETETKKCIMIVNSELPLGLVTNTAACLGFSLGALLPHEVGPPQVDASGVTHGGLLNIPIPILGATGDEVKHIVDKAYKIDGLTVFDMSDKAQASKHQVDYARTLAETTAADLNYSGVLLYGDKKSVNKLGGNLRLLGR